MHGFLQRSFVDRALRLCRIAAIGVTALGAGSVLSASTDSMTEAEAQQRINDELRPLRGPDKRARALALLAWPDEPLPHTVSTLARQNLVSFGLENLNAIRYAMTHVLPRYQADAVTAFLESKDRVPTGLPTMYFPALEDVIWFGTPDAKRIAIPEIAKYSYPPALMTIIDAAYEYPELREIVIDALGSYGNPRARYFLEEVLYGGTREERVWAADALVRIGGRGLDVVRDATLSDDRQAREVSAYAWLPVSTVDEVSRLYEYIGGFPNDDPQLIRRLSRRAEQMEQILEDRFRSESASDE